MSIRPPSRLRVAMHDTRERRADHRHCVICHVHRRHRGMSVCRDCHTAAKAASACVAADPSTRRVVGMLIEIRGEAVRDPQMAMRVRECVS